MSVHNDDTTKPEETPTTEQPENRAPAADSVDTQQVSHESEAQTESSDQESSEAPATLEELTAQLAEAQASAEENWDQLLRAKAEVENIRKRAEREASQARKYGLESIARELLPIYDSLNLGLADLEKEDASIGTAREGVKLIAQMMGKLMDQFSIREIDPAGEVFDPEAHQAMSMQETTEQPANTVIQVLQKGYRLNDRILRPAMVIVAKAPEEQADMSGNGAS